MGANAFRFAFQLFSGEPVEQGRVGDPAGTVGIEQVAQHGTASGFISRDGDETRQLAVSLDMRLGERIADAVGIALRPFGQVFPDFFLLLVIVADGESHEAIERHFALAVERNQLRADTRELEPLPHHLNRHAEPRGDIFVAHLLIGQRLEGVELVGGMHGLADFVFGKADLCRVFHIERVARHEKIEGDLLLLRQELQRRKPSATGSDLELAFACWASLADFAASRALRCWRQAARCR